MGHGSQLAYSTDRARISGAAFAHARRMTSTSAWAVGSPVVATRLYAAATNVSPSKIAAPYGWFPAVRPAFADRIATPNFSASVIPSLFPLGRGRRSSSLFARKGAHRSTSGSRSLRHQPGEALLHVASLSLMKPADSADMCTSSESPPPTRFLR